MTSIRNDGIVADGEGQDENADQQEDEGEVAFECEGHGFSCQTLKVSETFRVLV
jgi:hypothetical protein